MRRKNIFRRVFGILLLVVLAITAFPLQGMAASGTEYGIKNPEVDEKGVMVWDGIYFGNYWQNDTNGDGKADTNDEKEPILWRVLWLDGNDAFLISDKILDKQPYHYVGDSLIQWENSTLRLWLEKKFLNQAFTPEEQDAILLSDVENSAYAKNNKKIGEAAPTKDKVFLLSRDEILSTKYGFADVRFEEGWTYYGADVKRNQAKNTAYSVGRGVYDKEGKGYWWLRTGAGIGELLPKAWSIEDRGWMSVERMYCKLSGIFNQRIINREIGVRPVLHLNLSLPVWSKAPCIRSEEVGESTDNITSTNQNAVSTSTTVVTIKEKRVEEVKLKAGKCSFVAKWKKVSGAEGYQIQYAGNKSFNKAKTKSARGRKITIKKLKKKKTYYVRIRPYTVKGQKKVYGIWCNRKSVTTR